MKRENIPWYCVYGGLIIYFVGALFAADPVTISEKIGTSFVVISMGITGYGTGVLIERQEKS